jgi:hypothetical protein
MNGVELAGGDLHDELVGGVVGQGEPTAVDTVEGDQRCQCETLVAIGKAKPPSPVPAYTDRYCRMQRADVPDLVRVWLGGA